MLTVGALHHADASTLRAAATTWQSELAHLAKPLLIVNIGGPTSKELCKTLQIVVYTNVSEMFLISPDYNSIVFFSSLYTQI